MSESWKAFFFGSYDPQSTITLDKVPGFLWPQALSVRLFGFHIWALTLPQALEGVLSVLVLYRAVRRWAGVHAGLLAAVAFTATPVLAGLFRTTAEDPAFTLLLLLAADATQRAVLNGRLRSLLAAGGWVGLAFQAKMLEAWAVFPAIGLAYLVAAAPELRHRLVRVLLAGLVAVAVSASWVLLVTAMPGRDRPYIDGSTDNSAVSMVFRYNFLDRFTSGGLASQERRTVPSLGGAQRPDSGPGSAHASAGTAAQQPGGVPQKSGQPHLGQADGGPQRPGGADSGQVGSGPQRPRQGSSVSQEAGTAGEPRADGGWGKLFGSQFAPQTGWLYPLAVIGLFCGLAWRRRAPRTDRLRSGYLLWGGWLVVFFVPLSGGDIGPHSYYLGVIAAPLAALSGAGAVLLWRAFRAPDGGGKAWALPTAVAGTVGWSAYLAREYPHFLPWLAPLVVGSGAVSLLLLAAAGTGRAGGPRVARTGLLMALVAMLVAPVAWTASVTNPSDEDSLFGNVGPIEGRTVPPPVGSELRVAPAQQIITDYIEAHNGGARYLAATPNPDIAAKVIMTTGKSALPMGGWTGNVPSPTVAQFRDLVASGQVTYMVLLQGDPVGPAGAAVVGWAKDHCAPVPRAELGPQAGSLGPLLLLHCKA
ncbi:glycosyltransferase family 39 protein [Streptomyces sp. NPDC047022]|uniref:ArnT family glycosyltransferase n=1 Tax=Streptomyces sp. NPDC047022 TaxID=3155737 RepID=UPI0033CA6293